MTSSPQSSRNRGMRNALSTIAIVLFYVEKNVARLDHGHCRWYCAATYSRAVRPEPISSAIPVMIPYRDPRGGPVVRRKQDRKILRLHRNVTSRPEGVHPNPYLVC